MRLLVSLHPLEFKTVLFWLISLVVTENYAKNVACVWLQSVCWMSFGTCAAISKRIGVVFESWVLSKSFMMVVLIS